MKIAYQILLLLALLFAGVLGGAKHPKPIHQKLTAEQLEEVKAYLQENHVYVHLLAHSHDDVGWLKTVDEYFTGFDQDITHANVQLILGTVIEELLLDSKKRFSYVEMKFFSMFFYQQTEDMKEQIRMLVRSGRLEIMNAGWSMHDEACTHYEDIINNMMHGHQFLLKEFGVKPRIGWHIDPFGHSNANPRLFAEMGFDAWFFARLDYLDKQQRYKEKSMEYIWRPFSAHLGNTTQIFTHVLFDFYYSPDGFEYDDRTYVADPVVTNPELETYNADAKVEHLLERIHNQMAVFNGNRLAIVWGGDFSFSNARMNFMSMDRFIDYFNSHVQNVTIMYSTPSEYIDALKVQNITYPVKYDDMFPYADDTSNFWTGYFTSRANSKKQIRDGQANLHASNKVYALRMLDQSTSDSDIQEILVAASGMQDAQGINQHHDAVTGTAKQAVADDYIYRIYNATKNNDKVYAKSMEELIQDFSNVQSSEWVRCERLNGTYLDCPISDNQMKDHILVVHNPTVLDQGLVRAKVSHGNYSISIWNVSTQVFDEVTQAAVICVNRKVESGSTINGCDLHIKANLNASDFTIFQIKYNSTADLTVKETTGDTHSISGMNETLSYTGSADQYGVRFDLIKHATGKTYQIAFDLRNYLSYQLDIDSLGSNSGAYIFRPDGVIDQSSIQYATLREIKSFNGGFVQEIFMNFSNDNATQNACVKVRYYDFRIISEWEVYLAGIPLTDQGIEVTVNWKSFDINNNNTFYTDSNGLEMQKRILGYRPSYFYVSIEPISGNYYPINSALAIVDEEKQLQMTVMNDRSQGGTVVREGRIELMQNRRMYKDDGKGVDEALNETDQYGNGISVPVMYRLQFFERNESLSMQRTVQLFVDEPLQYFFSFNYTLKQAALQESLPSSPRTSLILDPVIVPPSLKYSLFPLERNKIMVRLENIGDRFDTDHWNLTMNDTTITFPMDQFCIDLFNTANYNNQSVKLLFFNYVENSLSNNQDYSSMMSMKFDWQVNTTLAFENARTPNFQPRNDQSIDLSQQRIRTFNVTYIPSFTPTQEEMVFLS